MKTKTIRIPIKYYRQLKNISKVTGIKVGYLLKIILLKYFVDVKIKVKKRK